LSLFSSAYIAILRLSPFRCIKVEKKIKSFFPMGGTLVVEVSIHQLRYNDVFTPALEPALTRAFHSLDFVLLRKNLPLQDSINFLVLMEFSYFILKMLLLTF